MLIFDFFSQPVQLIVTKFRLYKCTEYNIV